VYKKLNQGVKLINNNFVDPYVLEYAKQKIAPYVGSHVSKTMVSKNNKIKAKGYIYLYQLFDEVIKLFYEYKLMNYPYPPFQVFLSGNISSEIKETDDSINKALLIVNKNNLNFYTHAPYSINLCREEGCERPIIKNKDGSVKICKFTDFAPALQLKRELSFTRKMGGKGVVVHCGKLAGSKIEIGYANMIANIEDAASEATIDCPLLIETGSGNEICSVIYDFNPSSESKQKIKIKKGQVNYNLSDYSFVNLYNCLDDDTKKVTKVCLDTCHVFAAGWEPKKVIQIFEQHKIPIGLIHFNDSKCPLGGQRDNHARFGEGLMPFNELMYVFDYARKHNIPMVFESPGEM